MNTVNRYKRPTTYREMVQRACNLHAHRMAQLERAEEFIRAIEPDLAQLDQAKIGFDTDEFSMYLMDLGKGAISNRRSIWALHISTHALFSGRERLISGFIALGWTVESWHTRPNLGFVVLRKPESQVRIHLHGRPDYVHSILQTEDE